MQIGLIRCNNCKEERHVHPSVTIPHEWYLVKQGGHIVMPDMHFCTIECLMRWAVDEKIKIDNVEIGPTLIAGEDLRKGFVCQGPDGLVYQAKTGEPVQESNS